MAGFACVHHVEIGVVDGPATVKKLKDCFGFSLQATRFTPVAEQWFLCRSSTRLLVTTIKNAQDACIRQDNYVINWAVPVSSSPSSKNANQRPSSDSSTDTYPPSHSGSKLPEKDSVFNVIFQVKDIDLVLKRLQDNDVIISKPLRTIHDKINGGCVHAVTIKSCVGDIHHTLVQKDNYEGRFLPGFTDIDDTANYRGNERYPTDQNGGWSAALSFDHVALAVKMNTSTEVIGWYERCFGMKRFLMNGEEDLDQGLVLSANDVGLRLRSIEYWKCAEVGLLTQDESFERDPACRLSMVIAEGLPPLHGSQEENQVEAWIRKHGGPGIQHIAISCSDIKQTVRQLRQTGAEFAAPPPPAYYTKVGRLDDIIEAGEDVEVLKESGILIDTEADSINQIGESHNHTNQKCRNSRYLLQVFTKPILPLDPFFMELIQREGASGFGSGNVMALYRSVQAYIVNGGHDGRENR